MMSDMEYDLEIDEKEHAFSILESFGRMRKKQLRCDLTIKVGDDELKVNRELMITASDYLGVMLTHESLEKKTGIVNMKDVAFEFVKKCINFIYTGKISISFDKCESLLYVACMMQLWSLREYIGLFLKKYLRVCTFFNIRRMAVKFTIENLTKFCNEFAFENMDMIVKEKEFFELDADSVLSVLAVRKSSSPSGEDRKVFLILEWIKYDAESRQQQLVKMLNSVNLRNVSQSYSRSLIENQPLCYKSAACVQMLSLAVMDNHGVKRRKLDPDLSREPNSVVISDTKSQILQAFRPSTKTWVNMFNLHPDMAKYVYAAVSIRDYIFVVMGNKQFFKLNIIEKLSSWCAMKNMLEEHDNHISAAALGNFIYVAGNNSMERFSLRDDCWQKILCDGICLNGCRIVAFQDFIYTIGGLEHNLPINNVNRLSPVSLSWSPAEPLGTSRFKSTIAACEHKITVIGGYSSSRSMFNYIDSSEWYSPVSRTWTSLNSSPDMRFVNHSFIKFREIKVDFCCIGSVLSGCKHIFGYKSQGEKWVDVAELPCNEVDQRHVIPVWLPE